jgi:transposase-like protein
VGAPPAPQNRAAQMAERAERRQRAVKLSISGMTYANIAKELGYNSAQAAHKDVKTALAEALKRQDLAVDELRAKHTLLLDEALQVAHRIMNETHIAHSAGRLVQREVEQPDGSVELVDVIDNGPNLAAADRLIKISESQRKLWGIDAPTKTETTLDATVGYAVAVAPEELEQL